MSKTTYEVVVKLTTWLILVQQVRQQATDEADALLTESIRQHGVLQPVGARPDGTLVWGHRRVRCAIAAGLKELPVVILSAAMSEGEFLTLQMLENVQRADLCQYDLWQGCVRLMAANKGWKLQDLAKALSLDPSTVTKLMSPSKVVPSAVEALKGGKINLSHTYAISRLDEPAEQERLLMLALAGTSREKLEAEVKKSRAQMPETVKVSRIVCPLSTGVTLTVQGKDIDLEALIQSLQTAIEAARKGLKEQIDVKTWSRVMADKAKAV
jgi:ParB family transcriptional regulator, chromosome partitioning protein